MFGIIGTWKMCFPPVRAAWEGLRESGSSADAVTSAVTRVEDDPAFCSVGFGGLPDREGHVTLDAAFMNGDTLRLGAVMDAEYIKNPILAARLLCGRETSCLLAGWGAERFAAENGLAVRNMLTPESRRKWIDALKRQPERPDAYRGHDTVCVLALDRGGGMTAGVSTSGLFMKEPGRVGDSPLVGSGFYCDSRFGAAAATGLGEQVMRGCLSYAVVSLMRRGASPADACREALSDLEDTRRRLGEEKGSISLIALAPDGRFGAATTLGLFPFAAGDDKGVSLYACDETGHIRPVREEDLEGAD